jgi:multiple sugar transport system permease protein/sn-glycerol 3-phosphate transport system permease protein
VTRADLARGLGRATPYALVLPCLAVLGVFVYWPILYSGWLSLHDVNMLTGRMRWVGLGNYEAVLASRDFRRAVEITTAFVLMSVPVRLLVALMLAQLLVAETRAVRILRGAFFMPYVASTSAIAVIWSWMFQTDQGLINAAFGLIGLGPRSWLYDPATALAAVALVNAWKQLGYDIVLFVAGVQAISPALYEAARIDGASRWQQFRTITLPLLTPTLLFLLVVSVIDTFQVFTLVNVMTRGGPAGATDLIVHYFYRIAFIRFDYGDASAIAVLLLAGLLALTALKLGVFGRRVHYDLG